jgi:hypothetical protein
LARFAKSTMAFKVRSTSHFWFEAIGVVFAGHVAHLGQHCSGRLLRLPVGQLHP